ncbi:MAG: hypothetical protein JWQ49_1421 [Edaphobacter sp.]|nr:hypothetical protein [Edaphobacter sp.]
MQTRLSDLQMTPDLSMQDAHRGSTRTRTACRGLVIVLALIYTWTVRFIMHPDGVSYLDVGDRYWSGDWHAALNSCWSPLYSWLTGLTLLVVKPTLQWQFPIIHLLNWAIFVAALFSFEYLWGTMLARGMKEPVPASTNQYLWVLGYLLFAYIHILFHNLWRVTPDLVVAALTYLICAMVLNLAERDLSGPSLALFGVLLGLGYLAKAAMFVFAVVVLLTMLAVAWKRGTLQARLAIPFLAFALTCGPFVAALSWKQGHLTLGDAAKFNQALHGNQQRFVLQEGDPISPTNVPHPLRVLASHPKVYEFGTPIAGTFPLWYDPPYWNAGWDTGFHLVPEVVAIEKGIVNLSDFAFVDMACITTLCLVLFLSSGSWSKSLQALRTYWPILAPGAALVLVYSLVHVEVRYISAVLTIGYGSLLIAASSLHDGRTVHLLRAAAFALAVIVLWQFTYDVAISDKVEDKSGRRVALAHLAIAEQLHYEGVHPGDRVAVIGNGYGAYWARLLQAKIVADVPTGATFGTFNDMFWSAPPDDRQRVLDALRSTGARAVVAEKAPERLPENWQRVGGTAAAFYLFH